MTTHISKSIEGSDTIKLFTHFFHFYWKKEKNLFYFVESTRDTANQNILLNDTIRKYLIFKGKIKM